MFANSTLRIWSMLLFCMPAIVCYAQPKCKIIHYTTEEGLSCDRITSILKDSEGFMWFGTWDGINRFDGHDFIIYKSYPGDRSQLKNDRIDAIEDDGTEYLWLKDYDKQVYRFDKKNEQFLPMSDLFKESHSQKLNFDHVYSYEKGTVWLLTREQGIFFIPRTNLINNRYDKFEQSQTGPYALPDNHISFFYQDQQHNVWVGTPKGVAQLVKSNQGSFVNSGLRLGTTPLHFTGATEDAENIYFSTAESYLLTYNKKQKTTRNLQLNAGPLNNICISKKYPFVYCSANSGRIISVHIPDMRISASSINTGEPVYKIYEDKTGCLWVEPSQEGIIRIDPASGKTERFVQKSDANYNYRNEHPKVYEDNKGIVWVSMKNSGFGFYNQNTHTFDYFYNGPDPETHRFSNMVNDFYYDSTGILWLSTDSRGADKVIFQENRFNQHYLVNGSVFRSDNEVRGIYTDRKNRMWIGAKSGRLYITQKGKEVPVQFKNLPREGFGAVYSILQDRNGTMWLGTKQNGLFKAEPVDAGETTYTVTHYLSDDKDPNSLNGNDVYTLAQDKAGNVWAGTYDKGLNEVITTGHTTRFLNTKNTYRQYPKNAFQKIRHIAFDQTDNIWMGTTSGLLVMEAGQEKNPDKARFISYSKIPGDKASIGHNDVQYIYKDTYGTMWLLTAGGGLCQAIGNHPLQQLQFRNYTVNDGLPNNYLISCQEDNQHNLWLATQKGISRFNINSRQFRNYDSDDGLLKIEFSEASGTRMQDGTLAYGTINGYVTFNPLLITDDKINTHIAFTNLQVNNQDQIAGGKDPLLTYNINYNENLRLHYYQNNISIDYTVLDYRSVDKQDYVYRLTGLDTVWHNNQLQRRATYTNLAPGDYVFEVKSLNTELYKSEPVKSLHITILPPPWRTWWAYLLYLAAGVTLFIIIRKNALAKLQLKQRIEVEHKMSELKLSFFTNISHELRTPLTLILNPIQEIARKEKLTQEGKAHIDIVQKNAGRMVRFMNQLLDLRKAQSGKATLQISKTELLAFTRNIGTYFNDLAREKNIQLQISSSAKEVYANIDMEKIDIVLYNLLANAFKFSPAGKTIQVHIEPLPGDQVSIAISDEGNGVPENMLKNIFELYYSEGSGNAQQHKGSGIGLALARELVTLHEGSITAHNNTTGGLTVSLVLPQKTNPFLPKDIPFTLLPETIPHTTITSPATPPPPVIQDNNASAALPLVLLVEDNPELQYFLKNQLQSLFRVATACDGKEGLQKATSLIPDLILSDVMMPEMDGLALLQQLKNNPATSHIPVVLLSARSSTEHQLEGLQYGADLYITKPFNNEVLLASLNNLLRQRKKMFETLYNTNHTPVALSPAPVHIMPKDEVFLKKVIEIVEISMADVDFNIDSVAESMNMGRSTFFKKFKSLTDMAPVEFIRDMRLQRSKQLIDAGETNITTVAYAAGFNNAKYFSTCFKEKFHQTPSEYVKSTVNVQ